MNPKAVDKFLDSLNKINESLASKLKGISGSEDELRQLLDDLDFWEELNKAGFKGEVETLLRQFATDASKMAQIGGERVLNVADALVDLNYKELLGRGEVHALKLQRYLQESLTTGPGKHSFDILLSDINQTVPFSTNELTISIQTAYSNYDSLLMAKTFEDRDDVRFKLHGAYDDRTRYACKHVLDNQPKEGLTIKQINEGYFPYFKKAGVEDGIYDFVRRGRWNCRHTWLVVDD